MWKTSAKDWTFNAERVTWLLTNRRPLTVIGLLLIKIWNEIQTVSMVVSSVRASQTFGKASVTQDSCLCWFDHSLFFYQGLNLLQSQYGRKNICVCCFFPQSSRKRGFTSFIKDIRTGDSWVSLCLHHTAATWISLYGSVSSEEWWDMILHYTPRAIRMAVIRPTSSRPYTYNMFYVYFHALTTF